MWRIDKLPEKKTAVREPSNGKLSLEEGIAKHILEKKSV